MLSISVVRSVGFGRVTIAECCNRCVVKRLAFHQKEKVSFSRQTTRLMCPKHLITVDSCRKGRSIGAIKLNSTNLSSTLVVNDFYIERIVKTASTSANDRLSKRLCNVFLKFSSLHNNAVRAQIKEINFKYNKASAQLHLRRSMQE